MSPDPKAPEKSEGMAVSLLAFPFLAIEAAGHRILGSLSSKSKQQPKPPAVEPAEHLFIPSKHQQFIAADRVFSTEVRGRRVSFYQYFASKVIRITCRDLRHLKPIEFTPAIADSEALVYDIDGAIQWVRKNGLDAQAVKRAGKSQTGPDKGASQESTQSGGAGEKGGKAKPDPTAAAAAAPLNIVPATGNKSLPFTGRIVSFGNTTRKGGDQKPYVTYAMKLQAETGAYEKEFIGEHLSDLVTDLSLRERQLVCIQLVGKHHFEVEVDGKMQARSRNHYTIKPL